MMHLLAKTFNLDLYDSAQIHELKMNKSQNQRGQINNMWDYHFHGDACAFHNTKTGQYLDVKITHGLEYGVISDFFLYRFIETSPSLNVQFKLLEGKELNLRKVSCVLKREGFLMNLSNDGIELLVLNRAKIGSIGFST